jgi:hypothetical protein
MATIAATPNAGQAVRQRSVPAAEIVHRVLVSLTAAAVCTLVVLLVARGFSYYILPVDQRPLSPLHPQLRSSGTIGLRLGILAAGMFVILFLYPLRKRSQRLSRIGSTRRWLNFHVLFGIATPVVVTFHTAFKWHGLAGLAYWTMVAVALSGFVGRYVYAKIPRTLKGVELTMGELESQTAALAETLRQQRFFAPEELAPLLRVPSAGEVRSLGLLRTLGIMLLQDVARPFRAARLRRRLLPAAQRIATLAGLFASHDREVEAIVSNLRRQSRLVAEMAFLNRTERIFHLWHVIHRPFSISFVLLILVHIGVALSVGF